MVLLYVFVQVMRAAMVVILYPGLGFSGYGLSGKEALVLMWTGLRGAVALTLALLISVSAAGPYSLTKGQPRFPCSGGD